MSRRRQEVRLVPRDLSHLAVTLTLVGITAGWLGAGIWVAFLYLHKWAS